MSDPPLSGCASDIICEEMFDIDNFYNLCRHKGVSKEQKTLLQKYKKISRDGNKVLIQYDFGKNWNSLKFGDYYPVKGIGLASFSREIRACLAKKYYWDLDIANAHPVIIYNYCVEKGWNCPTLTKFIQERETIIAAICSEHNQERWWAKQECVKVFNGGYSCVHPILLELIPEIERIRDNVIQLHQKIYKKAFALHKNVKDASVTTLSLVFQNKTRELLSSISDFLKTQNRSLDTRIHDGGLVRILEGETEFPISLIRKIEKHIFDTCGYVICLEIKPLVNSFVFNSQDKFIDSSIIVNDSFACEKFVELVDIRKVGNEIYIFNPDTGRWGFQDEIKQQIINNKNNLLFKQNTEFGVKTFDYGGNSKNINALLSLLPQHVKEGKLPIVFEYTLCDEEYNERDEEIFKAYNSLVALICKGDEKKAIYDTSYFAHIIQKPYELPRVAMTYSGKEGAGKDTKINFIMKWIVGMTYCSTYTKTEELFEKHNIGRLNKLIVKIEEPIRKVCVDKQDTLKAFITSTTSDFNPKNVRVPIVVDNTNRLFFTTNYGCPFAITENDRRMALFDVSSERIKDKEYWNWIYNTLDNAYAGKVIGNFLASVDISNFNTTDIFPSEYMDVIKEESISIEKRFITSTQCAEEWDDWLSCNDVFILYRNWCKMENVEAYSANNTKSFGMRLIIPLRDGLIQRRILDGYSMYKLNSGSPL